MSRRVDRTKETTVYDGNGMILFDAVRKERALGEARYSRLSTTPGMARGASPARRAAAAALLALATRLEPAEPRRAKAAHA